MNTKMPAALDEENDRTRWELTVHMDAGSTIIDLHGTRLKCMAFDAFNERFVCCTSSLNSSEIVATWKVLHGDEERDGWKPVNLKICGICGRKWVLKNGQWKTLVEVGMEDIDGEDG